MPDRTPQVPAGTSVCLSAPARLHLGFLDMGAHLGRRFGSLGVGLERPALLIEGSLTGIRTVSGPQSGRVERLLDLLAEHFGFVQPVAVRIVQAIPDHAGLGSGTQLALAVGTLVARLHGTVVAPARLARALDRGNRSGIGIGAFEQGGFLVDGGRGADDAPPPILSRIPFPAEWRIVLLFDPERQGLHGHAEVDAFRCLPVFPQFAAARLCHLTLMQALPALAEGRLEPFGRAITEIQQTVGDHFAPAQGGRFSSPLVATALESLRLAGAACRGQSSWGPTGFAVAPDTATALAWVDQLRDLQAAGLRADIVEASTSGMRWHPAGARSIARQDGTAHSRA
jgi:beta-RFAP synthase